MKEQLNAARRRHEEVKKISDDIIEQETKALNSPKKVVSELDTTSDNEKNIFSESDQSEKPSSNPIFEMKNDKAVFLNAQSVPIDIKADTDLDKSKGLKTSAPISKTVLKYNKALIAFFKNYGLGILVFAIIVRTLFKYIQKYGFGFALAKLKEKIMIAASMATKITHL
ncbi:hypothetical protein BB560_004328 [Smittium megazygosporum]|uniref:Uncharacterized protein n=1 Tax=Smittium megazygosporum TaxID=133381 RepID=A0A2T9Z9I5_9FUNG|nr:hypothetical protein BB560_004328 [Smittium megazygosporum]